MFEKAPGLYAENHIKYECLDCQKEFIVGKETSEEHGEKLHCPYCGSNNTEWESCTTDELLEEWESEGFIGCTWIHRSVEIEGNE